MAKTNKYSSINFNHIYDKNHSSSSQINNSNSTKNPSSASPSFSSASYSSISSPNKAHGRMLVLTRPTPKPVTIPAILSPQTQSQPPLTHLQATDQTRSEAVSEAISLRPLGKTGAGSTSPSPLLGSERDGKISQVVTSPMPDKFVPPHLRPGFVGREERLGPEAIRSRETSQRQPGYLASPGRYGENGRPKSGGGHERVMRGGESNLGMMMDRPRSSGNRPSTSG